MTENPPRATFHWQPDRTPAALEFLKRTRSELRSLHLVRVWVDRLEVFDVNGDRFEIHGIGYLEADIVPLLRSVNSAFNPETIHRPTARPFKEYRTGRRHPWAEDRVM